MGLWLRRSIGASIVIIAALTLDLKTFRYSELEGTSCDQLEKFLDLVEQKHVGKLFSETKQEFSQKRVMLRAYDELARILDPYQMTFLSKEVDANSLQKKFAKNPASCADLYRLQYNYQLAIEREQRLFPLQLSKDEFNRALKLVQSSIWQKRAKKLSDWPRSDAEIIDKGWLLVRAIYYSIRPYVDSDAEALRVAIRGFNRDRKEQAAQSQKPFFENAVKSVTAALDAHSEFYTDDEFKLAMRSLVSSFVGVGLVVTEVEKGYKVTELIPGGPAQVHKSLRVGDLIERVSGHSVEGVGMDKMVEFLGGADGTSVKIEGIRRHGHKQTKFMSVITRGPVRSLSANIRSEVVSFKGTRLGYINLEHFFSGTSSIGGARVEFLRHLEKLNRRGIKGLLLDLRGNGGGVLDEVVDIAGYFMPSAPVVIEYGSSDNGLIVHSDQDGVSYFNGPVVVLVDESSASATEILAGSLRSYNRAVIVGSPRTFGKGTIQVVGDAQQVLGQETQMKGGLKLTVGYYFLPDGRSVQFDGVKSDIALTKKEQKIGEKNLRHPLAQPKKLDVEVKGVGKWMSDGNFTQMISYLRAQSRKRSPINKKDLGTIAEKQEALKILADMLRYGFRPGT